MADDKNALDAAARYLDEDEKAQVSIDVLNPHTGAVPGTTITIVNESGLYSLILRSRKPEAKQFKKWITAEVLPTIRKTGASDADGATFTEWEK